MQSKSKRAGSAERESSLSSKRNADASSIDRTSNSTRQSDALSFKQNIEEYFTNMVKRVYMMWQELKIPEADQTFYKESLCR